MDYIPNTDAERAEMLKTIGVGRIEDLFDAIPATYRFPKLDLPDPLTEMEVMWELGALSDANEDVSHHACFLGAGAYHHYIPSLVDHVIRRGEFLTAYTPYQPEVSQGTLQAIFEFQSMVGILTGMEIATASHYDGATAFTEGVLMAINATGRKKALVSRWIHPHYRAVLRTYTRFLPEIQIEEFDGIEDLAGRSGFVDYACAALGNPNFLGELSDPASVSAVAAKLRAAGALTVIVTNPMSLGILTPPGEYGADVVVGEGQPLGVPLSFGGPYLGFFCTRREYMRRIPGRIVGETVDKAGQRGYVLTLKTREQDIRREKATSNICTNQGLMALCASVYLSVMGKHGLQRASSLCYQKAHYAAAQIAALPGYSLKSRGAFFNEFVIACPAPVARINAHLLAQADMLGGYDLGLDYPELANHMLLCCTETNTREEIDALVETLSEIE
jgi:glycine dehydrogenase subunit 1